MGHPTISIQRMDMLTSVMLNGNRSPGSEACFLGDFGARSGDTRPKFVLYADGRLKIALFSGSEPGERLPEWSDGWAD